MNKFAFLKRKHVLILAAALTCAVVLMVLSDMTIGAQHFSVVLGGVKDTKPSEYYYDDGLALGKWQVIRPSPRMKDVGLAVWQIEGGSLPVMHQQIFYPDGSLSRDVKAFDSEGNEVPLHSPDTDPSDLAKLKPFPLIVESDFDESGNLAAEARYRNGVLEK
jgi:hypothetical protein